MHVLINIHPKDQDGRNKYILVLKHSKFAAPLQDRITFDTLLIIHIKNTKFSIVENFYVYKIPSNKKSFKLTFENYLTLITLDIPLDKRLFVQVLCQVDFRRYF